MRQTPEHGLLELNINAAWTQDSRGIGGIVRDEDDHIMAAFFRREWKVLAVNMLN